MKCNICNANLTNITFDKEYRGNFRPCGPCQAQIQDAVMTDDRLYDDSDPAVDIAHTISEAGVDTTETINET